MYGSISPPLTYLLCLKCGWSGSLEDFENLARSSPKTVRLPKLTRWYRALPAVSGVKAEKLITKLKLFDLLSRIDPSDWPVRIVDSRWLPVMAGKMRVWPLGGEKGWEDEQSIVLAPFEAARGHICGLRAIGSEGQFVDFCLSDQLEGGWFNFGSACQRATKTGLVVVVGSVSCVLRWHVADQRTNCLPPMVGWSSAPWMAPNGLSGSWDGLDVVVCGSPGPDLWSQAVRLNARVSILGRGWEKKKAKDVLWQSVKSARPCLDELRRWLNSCDQDTANQTLLGMSMYGIGVSDLAVSLGRRGLRWLHGRSCRRVVVDGSEVVERPDGWYVRDGPSERMICGCRLRIRKVSGPKVEVEVCSLVGRFVETADWESLVSDFPGVVGKWFLGRSLLPPRFPDQSWSGRLSQVLLSFS